MKPKGRWERRAATVARRGWSRWDPEWWLLLAAPVSLLGCFSNDSSPSGAAMDTLPGGRIVVTNTATGSWDDVTRWRLAFDLRLGGAEDGPEQFSMIGSLTTDAEGRVYLLDRVAQEIRVFNADGGFARTIGRHGRGPGEFMDGRIIGFGPGDTLWVLDPTFTRRYSAFDRDGTFLTSHDRLVTGDPLAGGFSRNGEYLDWGTAFPEEGPGVVAGSRVNHLPIRLGPGFAIGDSLAPLETSLQIITTSDGRQIPQVFFSEQLLVHQDDRNDGAYFWFAYSRQYQILRRSWRGDTTHVASLPADAAPVGESEREEIRQRFPTRLLSVYLDALPETKPVLRHLFGDGAGHFFVVPQLRDLRAGSAVDVFRESGEFLGRLALPAPMRVPLLGNVVAHATSEHLYYVAADEDDVPYLVRMRIAR